MINPIVSQLVNIYYTQEPWHAYKMSYESAVEYHTKYYKNGNIFVYSENGEVLGYYQRFFDNDTCILYNVWVKESERQGRVFRGLYKNFFRSMPKNIKYITGEKVKLGGKYQRVKIGGRHGND